MSAHPFLPGLPGLRAGVIALSAFALASLSACGSGDDDDEKSGEGQELGEGRHRHGGGNSRGCGSPSLARARAGHKAFRLQGRYADAEGCYQKTLVINETVHGPEHPSVAAVLQELAKLSTSQRRPEEAKQYQERAAAIFQKSVEASEKASGKGTLTLELE